MDKPKVAVTEWAKKRLKTTDNSFDVLFNTAPIMMHSIDRDGSLVKVNQCWLQTLGYTQEAVLGRKSVDFLTEESRIRAINDTLPLFWRTGSARSVGYKFVSKKGREIDVLLDAETYTVDGTEKLTYATLRTNDSLAQWQQSSTILKALRLLTQWRQELLGVPHSSEGPNGDRPSDQANLHRHDATLTREEFGALLEHLQDISINLRGLVRIHEESLDTMVEQQRELLGVARQMNKTLRDLADTLSADLPTPD